MDKTLGHSVRGKEKLTGEGSSVSSGSVVEIREEKMPEHSRGANEELMDGSNLTMVEMARWKQRYIYRVPEFIKKMTNRDAYEPQFVSLGPLHHGEPHLLPMQEHKRRAVLHMVNRTGRPLTEFVAAIEQVADELEAAYDGLDDRWRGGNRVRFVEMMVTDGCFLIELISIARSPRFENTDYAANDPVFSRSSFLSFWGIIYNDLIAMENQIPLVVLQRISSVGWSDTPPSPRAINNMVRSILDHPGFEEGMEELGLHFLDILHKSHCGTTPHWEGSHEHDPRTPCAVELSEAGIQFKKSNTQSIHDVDFVNGVLSMPLFRFYDETKMELLNLMAFEWLHPDAENDMRSYISFLDSIIESERDVALLRSQGIIENWTGSDKKVVEFFNTATFLGYVYTETRLGYVKWKMNAHCKKRWNKWRAIFMNNYLSNPWVFLSLVAAVLLLIATIMQTIYTVVAFYTNRG